MGLGDQIICNAITRHYSKLYDWVFLFIHERNLHTISFMYRDLRNIKLITLKEGMDWTQEMNFVHSFKMTNPQDDHIEIGFNYLNGKKLSFDQCFYEQINLDFSKRFSEFRVVRDKERELELFKGLGIKEKEYIFICNLSSTGIIKIDYKRFTKFPDKKIVYLEKKTNNLFDWIYTAENALEIHTMDSAFKSMIDSFKLNNDLYFYLYRENKQFTYSQNNWKIIK